MMSNIRVERRMSEIVPHVIIGREAQQPQPFQAPKEDIFDPKEERLIRQFKKWGADNCLRFSGRLCSL